MRVAADAVLLSMAIVAVVGVAAWRGWLRGIYAETADLVGLGAAALGAAAVWRLAGPAPAVVTLALAAVAVLMISVRLARLAAGVLVGPLRQVSKLTGSLLASVWAVVLMTSLLLLGTAVPGARGTVAGAVCDAPVARYLTVDEHPLHAAGQRLAGLAQPVMGWISGQGPDPLTLGAETPSGEAGLCEDVARRRAAAAATRTGAEGFTFPPASPGELAVAPDAETEVLARLNAARRDAGLAELAPDPELAAVGRAHARDMYLRGFFAHDTPECEAGRQTPGCQDPFQRIRGAGISYRVAGENLALAPSVDEAHAGLLASPGHRANMLAGDFTRVGIGVVSGPVGLMVTQVFAGGNG